MKILPRELERPHMIPINITYYNPMKDNGQLSQVDVLTIIYKDQDTNQKVVYEIKEPEIEIYIVKPELRTFNHMRDMVLMSECDKYRVKYRSRWAFAAKKLGLASAEEAKVSPYVYNADIQIETFYLIQFVMEYHSELAKQLSIGKLDIENDIIQCMGFPEYGEAPINAVTYVNMETNDVYTLVLLKDNLLMLPKGHPQYDEYQKMKDKFYSQVSDILSDPQAMVKKCHEEFDEMHPGMKYNILYYDDESKLMKDLMEIIHQSDNDYIGIWNLPYDMQNIMIRPEKLGMNPRNLIPDDRFSLKMISFREDTNPQAHKRKHECITSTVPLFVDDMVHYAGIRSGRGVLPSTKLNYVAQRELKDEKYDYSEISDIRHLFYEDLEKFILYNIKDVLLMNNLEAKTKDTNTIYTRMYQMCVFPKEAFTTTKVVWHSLIKFMYEKGYVPGTNRNKGKKHKNLVDYSSILGKQIDDLNENELDEFEDLMFSITEDENGESDESEEKYQGAFVMNTLHMKSTGLQILGRDSKYIHDNVADLDVGSVFSLCIRVI